MRAYFHAFLTETTLWIEIVSEMEGLHPGYLLPHEGANDVAYASFSFNSLAEYEVYRNKFSLSPKCQEAINHLHAGDK